MTYCTVQISSTPLSAHNTVSRCKVTEVKRGRRKIRNEERRYLSTGASVPQLLPGIIRLIKLRKNDMFWVCSTHLRESHTEVLVGKPEGKEQPLGRPKSRWKDSIRMDLEGIVCEDVNWIRRHDGVQWRFLMNSVMNIPVV
jgi:hypothetical protein